jgi:hypothetical protein
MGIISRNVEALGGVMNRSVTDLAVEQRLPHQPNSWGVNAPSFDPSENLSHSSLLFFFFDRHILRRRISFAFSGRYAQDGWCVSLMNWV